MRRRARQRHAILRLVDANANRALEGVRVCEEIVRFQLDAAFLFKRARALRHAIAVAVRRLPASPAELVYARGSRQDVGRRARSGRIASLEQALLINAQRAKEALRTLEECSRILAPGQAAAFQRARFRLYDLERDTLLRVAALRHRGPGGRRRPGPR